MLTRTTQRLRFTITALMVSLAAIGGCRTSRPPLPGSTGPLPPISNPENPAIITGRAAIEAGKYEAARTALSPVRTAKPPLAGSAEAAFLTAESYYRSGNRYRAMSGYKRYVEDYPISANLRDAEDRIFTLALEYIEGRVRTGFGLISHRGTGVSALEFILESFPRGTRSSEAQRILADYYYRDGRWVEAIAEYRELLQRFPRSEWVSIARYRIGMCYIRQSRGPDHDPILLERARDEFQRYTEAHPEGSRISEVQTQLAEIDDILAQKLLRTAYFYARDDEPEAALLYFRETIDSYPESDAAAEAQDAIADLEARIAARRARAAEKESRSR